jgi:ATP-independent RNA helicase DbpA
VTLQILGGRKEKIRPGDVLGALTGEAGFSSAQIGKINITEYHTYVAVARDIAQQALRWLASGKIKGKTVKVRIMGVEDDAQAGAPSRANAGIRRRPQG